MKFRYKQYSRPEWEEHFLRGEDAIFKEGIVIGGRKHWSHLNIGEETVLAYQELAIYTHHWWVLKRAE